MAELSSTMDQLPSHEVVIDLCAKNGVYSNGFAYNDQIWIKYGTAVTPAEAAMQKFVHENADHRIVYTPAVYDTFSIPRPNSPTMTYIVMEKVEYRPYVDFYKKENPAEAEIETMLQAIADAARHIWSLPLPPNTAPGPFFGAPTAEDRFFSNRGSGITFASTEKLEEWINGELAENRRDERVDLQSLPFHLCHMDLTQFNILVGKPTTIIDWGWSGAYPIAFEEYSLFNQFNLEGANFAKALHQKLFGEKLTRQMRPMSLAARINQFGL